MDTEQVHAWIVRLDHYTEAQRSIELGSVRSPEELKQELNTLIIIALDQL